MPMEERVEVLMVQAVPRLVVLPIGLKFQATEMALNGIWNLRKVFQNGMYVRKDLLMGTRMEHTYVINPAKRFLAPSQFILIMKKFVSK